MPTLKCFNDSNNFNAALYEKGEIRYDTPEVYAWMTYQFLAEQSNLKSYYNVVLVLVSKTVEVLSGASSNTLSLFQRQTFHQQRFKVSSTF